MFTGRAPIAQPPGNDTSALTEACEQRTEHDDRRSHRAHELIRRHAFADRRRIDLDAHFVVDRDAHAHTTEQLDHRRDVAQMRHVADRHRALASSVAARIGSAAFFAPEMRTSPSSGMPPRICNLSMIALMPTYRSSYCVRFVGRVGLMLSAWISRPIARPSVA